MKRKILSIISIFVLLLVPFTVLAKTEYETMNLKETLTAEEIELENKDYKETDDQITIYMFRGTGCGYCKGFLTFLNSISTEYGKYFKLKSYEVWQNQKNADLFVETSEFLGQQASGVPFIVIGEKVFPGYADVYDEDIKAAIKDLYDSEDRYDVMEEMEKAKTREKIKEIMNTWALPISLIGIVAVWIYSKIKCKNLNARIDELEEKLNKQTVNETKEKTKEKVKDTKEKNKDTKKINKKKDK